MFLTESGSYHSTSREKAWSRRRHRRRCNTKLGRSKMVVMDVAWIGGTSVCAQVMPCPSSFPPAKTL